MDQPLFTLEKVTFRYAGTVVSPIIDLSLCRGQHLAITGTNEALINALLEVIAGSHSIINGTRKWHSPGNPVSNTNEGDMTGPQHKIAMVSSRHHFRNLSHTTDFYYQQRFNSCDSDDSISVREYLSSLATSTPGTVWNFTNVVEQLHLLRLLDEGLIKLSNGETKRVLIAAALLQNPQVLLLQNPLAGLDIASRKEIASLIDEVADTGITIVMSTRPEEIPACIHTVVIANAGQPFVIVPKKDFIAVADKANEPVAVDVDMVENLLLQQVQKTFDVIVQMNNVTIRYGDHVLLNGINWTIQQGERWALVGPNGAGKSTLLSLIAADNPQAFANDIVLFDRKKGTGESIWDIKRNIGFFSPELYQYFPMDTSALQAVESGFYDTIGLFRKSQAGKASIASGWMKLLGIAHNGDRLLRSLSAAEQRLCLLARAFVKCPPLLILDEPCQGLSEPQKQVVKQLINFICSRTNTTLIYVSHYADEIPDCVTKTYHLKNGRQVLHP